MAVLPIELLLRIFQWRLHLCLQLCMDSWKKEWKRNIALVNVEYTSRWTWDRCSLTLSRRIIMEGFAGHHVDLQCYNYRCLQKPQNYPFPFAKMGIFRPHTSIRQTSNFPLMHYFYTIRPQFECTDWFFRFLRARDTQFTT